MSRWCISPLSYHNRTFCWFLVLFYCDSVGSAVLLLLGMINLHFYFIMLLLYIVLNCHFHNSCLFTEIDVEAEGEERDTCRFYFIEESILILNACIWSRSTISTRPFVDPNITIQYLQYSFFPDAHPNSPRA